MSRNWSPRDGDWRDHAACLDHDPELFFPIGESLVALHQLQQARAICAGCPVRTACLTFALRSNVQYGVWAGTVPQERARLRRRVEIISVKAARRAASEPVGRST